MGRLTAGWGPERGGQELAATVTISRPASRVPPPLLISLASWIVTCCVKMTTRPIPQDLPYRASVDIK